MIEKTKKQLIMSFRKEDFDLNKVEIDLTNSGNFQKPEKALWSSTFEEGASGWVRWLIEENDGWTEKSHPRFFLITPKPNTRVFTVDTEDDEIEVPKDSNGDVDFIALKAAGYAGLRATDNRIYFRRSATREFDLLYGWDCESTAWFSTDWIESVQEIQLPEVEREAHEARRRLVEED